MQRVLAAISQPMLSARASTTSSQTSRRVFVRAFSASSALWTREDVYYWVKNNNPDNNWSMNLPPAYYPPGEFRNKNLVYRTPWILKVSVELLALLESITHATQIGRRILYGSTALRSPEQLEPPKTCDGSQWDADATVGFLATCCVLVRPELVLNIPWAYSYPDSFCSQPRPFFYGCGRDDLA